MRRNLPGTSPFEAVISFSRAVRVGQYVHVSGTAPVGAEQEDAEGQTRQVLALIAEVLQRAGASLQDVVRTRIYLTDAEDWEAVACAHGDAFREILPAATMVVVSQLLNPSWRVEIEADAFLESAES